MSTHDTHYNSPSHPELYKPGRELKVSAYDNVSGLLVALLILVGFIVAILFIIFLTTRVWFVDRPKPVLVENAGGRGEVAEGIADEMEEPGAEEVDELIEPQLKETMEAVTDVASSIAATLEAMQGNSALTGHGSGPGSSRAAGPGGDGDGQIPRWERWKIRYPPMTDAAYLAMLSGFGIEIGCFGPGRPGIDIISNFSSGTPQHRRVDEEERLYFRQLPESGNRAIDESLLQRVNVPTANRIIVHLYPPGVENDIAWAEKEFMDARMKTLQDIRETILGVRSAGGKQEFYVIDQVYR